MSADREEFITAPERVLMTTDAVGGVWQYSVHLASWLAKNGAEILLVSFGPRPAERQKEQVRGIPGLRLVETDFALEWMPNPWDDIDRSGDWLLSLEREFSPQIIHLNGYSHGVLPFSAPTLVVAHSCVYSWWQAVHQDRPGADWEEYKARVTRGLQSCTAVAAPSAYMAEAIANEYGVAREKIEVIYNSSSAAGLRKLTKQPFALAAARFSDAAKNLWLLDRIAPRLDWQVRVAGSAGDCRNSALEHLGALAHDDLLQQFQRASLFLHPALYEPFGLTVLEAASTGCCLALADIPSLRELWGGAAVFMDPRDPEQWIFEVNNLTRDFALRESLAREAGIRSRRYQTDQTMQCYLKLYGSLREGTRDRTNGVAA